ncbi:perlucin-like protein [Patiria miniata]|uniref:C-type lectin domain-containing protein n=1 Tax=Patiria miniata TaxID=46514 RepID=A0A913Z268_PATMI|nr:perlucin-like protein [Patiria miniata]
MAAPRSLEEMNFMTDKAREIDDTGDYFTWIACNDKEVEETWECDGQEGREPFLEWDLASGQPDSISAQSESGSCHSRLTLECSCPSKWQLREKECYILTPSPHTWNQAKSACHGMGGKMAAPRSLEEMNFMADMARKVDSDYYAWISCNDKEVEGTWVCDGQDGSEPFLKWADGQPDDKGNHQDCGQIAARYRDKMDDVGCDNMHPRWTVCVRQAACTYGLIQPRH